MFNPNKRPIYHHRCSEFHKLYTRTQSLFLQRFNIPKNYDVVFVTGSGTFANEIVIASLCDEWDALYADATFGWRLNLAVCHHEKQTDNLTGICYPLYETSISRLNKGIHNNGIRIYPDDKVFLDAVSAFPYYNPHEYVKDINIWTTVSSKQIGALPVLGIIVYRSNIYQHLRDFESVLCLKKYIDASDNYETPCTPAITLIRDLHDTLELFNPDIQRVKIDTRWRMLQELFPDIECDPPVFTIPNINTEIATKYKLYKSSAGYQIFTWSGTDEEYGDFANDCRRQR